ncbi:MAG: hypothetical protein OEY00_12700, partial [Gammaproteobacteria bacterium]|nr:hypothetical protein [Gammaproteobacteria bacterium]
MAHQNILITDEMFELRSSILSQSISEANIADDLRDEWLEADRTLKQAVVKSSIDECRTMFDGQRIYDIPRP